MNIIFGHWKYIFKNIWFVLPFAVIPAVFLAISIDYGAIEAFLRAFFGGEPECDFLTIFSAWSLIRVDSALGAIYSVCAFISAVIFLTFLLFLTEKHMRIGKRTFSGIMPSFSTLLLPVACIVLLFTALYEAWAVVLTAMLYSVSAISARALVYVAFVLLVILFFAVLLYLTSIFYLWLPCMQITGMRAYSALLYSYRLMGNARGRLILSFAVSLVPAFLATWGASFLPDIVSIAISFVLALFLTLSFAVRMETVYFATDKIDREDLLLSYKEL